MWTVGFGFTDAPIELFLSLGPLFTAVERDEPPPEDYDDLLNLSWTLFRIVFLKWKLEMRFELDLNIWRIGYMMADLHDHGIYLEPFNLQIEYNKMYEWPTISREPRDGGLCTPGRTSIPRRRGCR